jgi:hypothetical protein
VAIPNRTIFPLPALRVLIVVVSGTTYATALQAAGVPAWTIIMRGGPWSLLARSFCTNSCSSKSRPFGICSRECRLLRPIIQQR